MINRYLKCELNVSYRKLRPVSFLYNSLDSKLQRQFAAAKYITYLYQQKRIINIDESAISLTETVRRGWMIKGVKNKSTMAKRPDRINLIAGISNYGDLFYTINHGQTKYETFLLFLMKICEYLHSIDKAWRNDTIILLDNASYHRGASIM